MKIAVVCHVRAGHVSAYHRLYVEHFRMAGCEVLDLGPPEPPGIFGRVLGQLERFGWWRGRQTWRRAAQRIHAAEKASGGEPAKVFFSYLDSGFLEPKLAPSEVERWLPRGWAGVVNGPAAVKKAGQFSGKERVLAAKYCRALVVTDDSFVAACKTSWPGKPVVVMPELADLSPPATTPELVALRAWVGKRRLVGLLGVISAKKNVAALLACAGRALVERPDLAFVIAGDFSAKACSGPERRALGKKLAHLPANCRFYPEPISEGPHFNGWVTACDYLWLAYRNVVYKSNMLTKAAHFRRAVLVSPGGVMAAHTVQYRLGEIVDPENSDQVMAAFEQLMKTPADIRAFDEFSALNSNAKLAATVQSVLQAFQT